MAEEKLPRVVIVGAGFGGLEAAKKLACEKIQLIVIDRTNYHLFQPLLYQVATAALSPADIASPFRSILRGQRNVRVVMGEVIAVDRERRVVELAEGEAVPFEFLIVAPGSRHWYFGKDDWEQLGVVVKLNATVTEVNESGVFIGKTLIETVNVIWAAGNRASRLLESLKAPMDRQGRVIVQKDLTISGEPFIFVIGDAACHYD